MAQQRKAVIVGVDGATFDLIRPWVAQGHLSNFRRLMEEGSHAVMRAPITAPLSPASWSSFATGLTPAHHGILDFIKLTPYSYGHTIQTSRMRRGASLWDYLGQRGRTVGVSEVPLTYPPDKVNGYMISGHPAPTQKKTFTSPKSLQQELLKAVPDMVSSTVDAVRASLFGTNKHARFAEGIRRMTRTRLQSGLWLFERSQQDLFCHVLVTTDWASHFYWHFADPESPLDVPAEDGKRHASVILEMYEFADQFIGEMLRRLGDETTLFVMSDHGFCRNYDVLNMHRWLADRGLLAFTSRRERGSARLIGKVGTQLTRALPRKLMHWLNVHFPKAMRRAREVKEFGHVNFSRTHAYPMGTYRHIYINLRGRQPQGIVEPGEQYEQLRTRLIGELAELRHPRTGSAVVRRVHRREEIMQGPFLEEAPDLLIEWADHTFRFGSAESGPGPVFSALEISAKPFQRTADHAPEGILLAYGRDIGRGRELPDCMIMDVLPTVMHAMGEPVPEGVDGRVLEEFFTEEFRAENPVSSFVPRDEAAKEGEDVFAGEEDKEVAEHLRGLGYID